MKNQLAPAVKMLFVLTILTGVLYPLLMTVIASSVFPRQASGSMIEQNGVVVGSALIGQNFTSAKYFQGRPSAGDYNPLPSTGSNFGPTSDTLRTLVDARENDFRIRNGVPADTPVPPVMLTASGSGLDPHITPEAALLQVDRVATTRGYTEEQHRALRLLAEGHIERPQLGFLGEPRVNVLLLNLALDQLH